MGKTRRYNKFHVMRGSVVATDWDDEDRLIAVSIVSDDDELLIDPYGKGEALLDCVDEYVEVRGVVHNDDGYYSLTVHGFRVIDDDDGEDEASGSGRFWRAHQDGEEEAEEDVA